MHLVGKTNLNVNNELRLRFLLVVLVICKYAS